MAKSQLCLWAGMWLHYAVPKFDNVGESWTTTLFVKPEDFTL